MPMKKKCEFEFEKQEETPLAMQRLAREEMKHKLLADITMDMEVCKLENLDPKEYLQELKEIIDVVLSGFKSNIPEKDYEKMKKIHEENSEYIYEESEEVEDE